MTIAPIQLAYSFAARIPFARIQRSVISYSHEALANKPGTDLRTRARNYPPSALPSTTEHVANLLALRVIGDGSLLTQTHRNGVQNRRTPLFSREHGICQAAEERAQASARPYHGIAHLNDGSFRAQAIDFRRPIPNDIEFWGCGIPVLWNDRVLTVAEIVPEVADFCHLWALDVSPERGQNPEHVRIYDRLSRVFAEFRHSPAGEAANALLEEAGDLPREESYLHNVLGVGNDHLIMVMGHGRLEDLGRMARSAGATHAIVVDNGGSCQIAVRRRGQQLNPVIQSHYYRVPTIAVSVYELEEDTLGSLPITMNSRLIGLSSSSTA